MKPLSSREIRGNWATLLAVWNADESLDLHRVAAEIDTLVAMRVSGIYSNGTAGEFHTLDETEFDQLADLLASRCNAADMPFQIGVSHPVAQTMLARLQRVVRFGPSAVQIILPDWFPLTNPEAVDFLRRMADAACGIGLVLYNPPHAKRRLSPDDLAVLADAVPELVGIKVPGGDDAWYAAMRPITWDLLPEFRPMG